MAHTRPSVLRALVLFVFAATASSAPQPQDEAHVAASGSDAPTAGPGRIYFAREHGGARGWSILSITPYGDDLRVDVRSAHARGEYNPCVSPDGSALVWNSYRYGGWKLAIKSFHDTEPTRLSPEKTYDINGIFSPDGARVLYEKGTRSDIDLAVVRTDGSDERNLTEAFSKTNELGPVWLPDGDAIVYFSKRAKHQQIYSIPFDPNSVEPQEPRNLTNSQGNDFAPAISPARSSTIARIAFYSDRDGYADLFVMNVDGSDQRNLTEALHSKDTKYTYSGQTYWSLKAAWSPDGREIVFAMPSGSGHQLFIAHADGSTLRQITFANASSITPCWGVDAGGR